MSIENHKWSDDDVLFVFYSKKFKYIALDNNQGESGITLDRSDIIALAKHFNVDNESLVEGVKELIATTRNKDVEVFSANDLQKLITKENIEE